MGAAVTIEVSDANVDGALDIAAQIGHRQTPFVDEQPLVGEHLDLRVDDHGERHARFVAVAGVLIDLDDRDPLGHRHLVGGEAGAAGGALGLDHVVDQALHVRRRQLLGGEFGRALAEHGVTDGRDRQDAHEPSIGIRTPRSPATVIARS